MKTVYGTVLAAGLAAMQLSAQTAWNTGALPLAFEANHGQAKAAAAFIAHGPDSEFLLSATGAQFVLRNADGQTASAHLQFVNANPAAEVSSDSALAGHVNYLIGNQPANWLANVPTFAKVRVNNLYPGVDVVYYGNGRQLEYDFTVAPGVDPKSITLHFDGTEKLSVTPQGQLLVSLNGGEIVQHAPLTYQKIGDAKHEVTSGYRLIDAHTAAFTIGDYNHELPLVIDPVLQYSSFFGGNNADIAHAIAVDTNGNIYIAGETLSTVFTNIAKGGYETNFHGGNIAGDAFVAKFDSTGQNKYFTYLGGSSDDAAYALAVDTAGHAYITGATASSDFPKTNALFGYQASSHFPVDAFVAELDTDGSKLIYSTYLSGDAAINGYAIAVDTAGNAYVAGYVNSTNLPVTATALQKTLQCTNTIYYNANAFIAEIAANGTSLSYCSYLGGTNYDQANSIFVDPSGYVYVAGYTASPNFPATNALAGFRNLNGATNKPSSAHDAFVCKFQPGCSNWVYSTFLGGTNDDVATGVTADSSGNAYVVGWTVSTNFYDTINNNFHGAYASSLAANGLTNNFQSGHPLTTNAFLVKIAPSGGIITNALIFGGSKPTANITDQANGVALDAAGNIYIVGSATSTNFPTTNSLPASLLATNSGASDVFVTAIKSDWSSLLYSTYIGGRQNDFGNAIAVDPATGNAYITGQTFSTNYPSFSTNSPTFNASQTRRYGNSDAFITEILPGSAVPLLKSSVTTTNVLLSWKAVGQQWPSYYTLQTSTNFLNPNSWTTVTNPVIITNNDSFIYPFGRTNPAQVFRLRMP